MQILYFNERSNEDLLVFGGIYSNIYIYIVIYSNFHGFSNYFPCKIKFKNKLYCNAEQAYQHRRALFVKVLEKCTKNLIRHSRLAFNNHESNIDC